jgi:exosortase
MTVLAELTTRRRVSLACLLTIPLACLAWAYWPTFLDLADAWQHNPQYSHGYLVPAFALFLLWLRRDKLPAGALRPNWWGIPLLVAGLALRLYGAFFYYVWLDGISLIPTLAGLCLMLGGRAAWRWAWPSILFLAFAVPMPYRIASALSGPLQRTATVLSTFVMQTIGLPALSEGNVILLDDFRIGIVEACNGLNMMVVFFALAAAVALLMQRPWLDKCLILASAVPIAVASNVARITITGILFRTVNSETANAFFHDLAGWLMMPFALAILWAELWVLGRLFLEAPRRALPRRTPVRPGERKARATAPQTAGTTQGRRTGGGKRRPARTPYTRGPKPDSPAPPGGDCEVPARPAAGTT